ncbi:unnamed protein product [Penicillium egyptiacum]|uniref:Uncharacterized protein n=1 Tax=Penicillium egyptiacum TaxID=1303716 RepID=A0A9W4P3B7_9EURO|nr:unnamed protein product [Penicillium egyptiacum]
MPESIAHKLFRGTRAILKYWKERGILVKNIRSYVATLRSIPEGNYLIEIALNVQSLKIQCDKVKWASEALAVDAAEMAYVNSKGIAYFTRTIPQICDEVGRDTRQMAKTLHDHIHRRIVNIYSFPRSLDFIHSTMPHINQSAVSAFRKARDDLVTLLEQQSRFLRHDIDSRAYVIPNLRFQLIQHLDIVASLSMKMAVDSRHHPYVLVHQSGFYKTVVPMHCAALKCQCTQLANRLRDNLCTDVPIGSGIGLLFTTYLVYSSVFFSYVRRTAFLRRYASPTWPKRERAAFIFDLETQARVLRANLQAGEIVAESLRELVYSVHRLKDASMTMAVDARANAYVLAKPYGFYSYNVPRICNDLVACLLHWVDILVNTNGRSTDGIVVDSIEDMLGSLGF